MVLFYALVTWTIIKTIGKATGPNTFTICITSTYLDPWFVGWISIMITHTSSLCWRVVIFPLKAVGSSSHNVTPGQRETMFFTTQIHPGRHLTMFLSQKGGALALLLPSLGLAGGCAQFAQFRARDLEENSSASRWLRDADLAAGELPQKRD